MCFTKLEYTGTGSGLGWDNICYSYVGYTHYTISLEASSVMGRSKHQGNVANWVSFYHIQSCGRMIITQ